MIDVAVIGAGAAGLMAALTAGGRGRSVTVLERGARIGSKILISGGGRCNFTNRQAGPENYLSSQPDFCKSALARYRPADFLALVERHRIAWHEKKLGQLFCDGSSREIVEMLQKECSQAGVKIETGVEIQSVRRNEAEAGFALETTHGPVAARRLVVATGALSLPKLGATDFAYALARQFGLRLVTPRAGLVPFTFPPGETLDLCRGLSGVSIPCAAQIVEGRESPRPVGDKFSEALLFTHRGLSGPALLQVSSWWQAPHGVRLDLFPGEEPRAWLEARRSSGRRLHTVLAEKFPERFATAWTAPLASPRPLRDYGPRELDDLAHRLKNWTLHPAGTEGYATAEVTVGGIDTRDLYSKTMEAREVTGLYFIGEAVDVTGWLGGYNFQWAWASGHACGEAVASAP
jgi:predicted Rossmann fold flavoprotein